MTISANFPVTRPSLLLDFSNQTVLDPRVTFARTTTAYYYDNKSAALAEQNLLTYSNTLTNAAWGLLGVGTPVVGATDPAGGATAYTVTASAGLTFHGTGNSTGVTVAASVSYTASCYLQAGTNNFASLGISSSNVNFVTVTFNLTSGSVAFSQAVSGGNLTYTASSATVTQVGSTNWWRCSFVFTCSATQTAGLVVQLNNSATPTLASNGYGYQNWTAAGTETLLVYGAQLEQRSTPTVYTATTATAVNTYTPTLQTAAINAPRFDYDPVTRTSLGLLLEQASTNLALYSSDYTNAAWTKSNCTITANADISPDGTQNAQLMVLSAASIGHLLYQFVTLTAGVNSISFYLKSYGQQFVQIRNNNNGVIGCNFDLINGTAGTPYGSGSPVPNIQNVGNGWYRCSLTFTALAASTASSVAASNSLTASDSPAFAGNGFNGYLVWGAQVELAPSATSYIATVASAQTRTVDSASMTGTNFTSWYNYSGGTVYVEAATGNPTTAATPNSISFNDNSTTNRINFYYSTGVAIVITVNNVQLQNAVVALPSTIAANTFYKTAWYYSAAGNGVSSAGQTATTTATAISAPAINQLNLGSQLGSSGLLNGRIKKFAYYPAVLTNTQIQSLSAN